MEQIRRDARGPESVAIGLAEPYGFDAPLDHPEHNQAGRDVVPRAPGAVKVGRVTVDDDRHGLP